MDRNDIEALKRGVGKRVVLGFGDGEVTVAEPHLVSDESADVIYDVVSTNRPERYKTDGAAYQAALADIQLVAGPEVLTALISVLFAPDEQPMFIDSTASVEEVTGDTATFASRVQETFGISVNRSHLAMTVPEFALNIRRLRR
jgi:hypothetical protein